MVLCLFYCAARFAGKGCRIGAGSETAVCVGFNAAEIRFIYDSKHGNPLKLKSNKCAENRAHNARAQNVS